MAHQKIWNWQQSNWPDFTYDAARLRAREEKFLIGSGHLLGAFTHIHEDEKLTLTIEVMSDEALKTSEIEGEYLNRDSVQSSIRRMLGLATDARRVKPAEQGIANMMVDLYKNFAAPLTHEALFTWHRMLTNGRADLLSVGDYRKHDEPMQVVSGRLDSPTVHFEAPPSKTMHREMSRFIAWFNSTASDKAAPLAVLTRASIAHLFFVSIHPFEDGNGRIARALAEKSLAQSLAKPSLLALSQVIHAKRSLYYDRLEASNKSNQIDGWLDYFSDTILEAQEYTIRMVEFLIAKARFYDSFRGWLNDRQSKVIERMFRQGLGGFKGGLSAENYIRITGTSRATATRDLTGLVKLNAFTRTGIGKGTRYGLHLK